MCTHGHFGAVHRTSSLTFHCMRRLPIIRMGKLLNEPMAPSVIMAIMITGDCISARYQKSTKATRPSAFRYGVGFFS